MNKKYFKLIFFSFALCLVYFLFASKPASAAIIRKAPNNLGLLSYWKLDEGATTNAGDSSGNGRSGTLNTFALTGATSNWVSGKHGKALNFDGSSDYVDTSDFADNLSEMSVAFWFNTAQSRTQAQGGRRTTLIGKMSNSGSGAGWQVRQTFSDDVWGCAGNSFDVLTQEAGGSKWVEKCLSKAYNDGKWHHFVWTFTGGPGSGATFAIYIDGKSETLVDPGSTGTFSSISTTQNVILGKDGDGNASSFYGGSLDDVRIYNRAISATQVSSLYQTGQVTRKTVSNQGLVGYWAMNEGRGNVVGDSSGNGNHGSATSTQMATWVGGKRGGALDFDGSNDYVLINSTLGNFGTSDFTAAAWIKPSVIANDTILGKRSVCDHDSFWNMTVTAAGILAAEVDQNAGGVGYIASGGVTTLATSTWYHAAMVRSASNLKVYLNGVEEGSVSTTTTANISNSAHLLIGGTPCSGRNFTGLIDDVRLYSRALSGNEVYALYRQNETKVNSSQNDKFTNGLVGLWSFNSQDYNAASTTAEVLDQSGQGNNGDAVSGPIPAPGKVGQGFKFDGTDDYVAMSGTTDPTAYTISTWVKKNSTAGATIFLRTDASGPGSTYSHMLSIFNNKFVSYAYDGNSKENIGTTVFKTGEWYHVVGTAENNGYVRLYVNGVEEGTPVALGTLWLAGDRYRIGSNAACVGCNYFDGIIDEVRLYNRALSATEVKQLYNLGR